MLTARKTTGVLIAMMGVSLALLSGLESAPSGAWRGHALMVCAAVCMTFYSIWSRPFISRLGPLQFTTMGMGVGALFLIAASWSREALHPSRISRCHNGWPCCIWDYSGALTFFLWSFALSRTTPTRVTISISVDPVAATLVGAILLDGPVGWNLIFGISAVAFGIWIATTNKRAHGSFATRVDRSSGSRPSLSMLQCDFAAFERTWITDCGLQSSNCRNPKTR
jgi:drug/metabolite transporter (DMT)-like permease